MDLILEMSRQIPYQIFNIINAIKEQIDAKQIPMLMYVIIFTAMISVILKAYSALISIVVKRKVGKRFEFN